MRRWPRAARNATPNARASRARAASAATTPPGPRTSVTPRTCSPRPLRRAPCSPWPSWRATAAGAARLVIRPLPTTIAVLALCGTLVVIYATPLGPWVFSDSTEYIVSARNLVSGRGLGLIQASGEFQPIYLHPPLYPLILAGGGFLGVDVAAWARVLNAILFGGTVMLVAGLIHYATKSAWMAIASALTVAINPVMLRLYTGAMPEPVFFVAGLGAMLLLMSYWSLRTPWRLGAAGILCGVAILTRYPGVVFVAVGVLGLAFFGTAGLKRRTRDIGLFAVLALLPLVVWQAWLGSQYEVAFGRQWNFETGNLWQALVPFRIGIVTNVWGWIPYNTYLPPLPYYLKPRLLLAAAKFSVFPGTDSPITPRLPSLSMNHLTGREREVLRLLASGVSTKAVAQKLFISRFTARNHIQKILAKLKVHSRLEAATLALRNGLL